MQGAKLHARPVDAALLGWLGRHGLPHEVHEHRVAFSALAAARADGIAPRLFLKVVAVETDDARRFLLVLDATHRVDPARAARVLGATHVRLLDEPELERLAPLDEIGTLMPVPELYGVPMVADEAVGDATAIAFAAGSHRFAIHLERADWERATGVRYAPLAIEARPGDERRETRASERSPAAKPASGLVSLLR